jgi:Protein of unknown function (DUF1236)
MRHQLCAGAVALALFSSIGLAAAQTGQNPNQSSGQSGMPSQGSGNVALSPSQGQNITNGLSSKRAQSAPSDFDGRVGTKVPDSMAPKSLPSDVTAQVPEAQRYLFVKMPDRVLLIDPDNKTIVEIVPSEQSTSGSSPD